MKKLTLSLVAAGLTAASLGAYAAVPTGAAPFQVVVPCLKSGIEVTLEGMYLQPSNDNLQYSQSVGTTIVANNVNSVNPQYNFGFRTALGYIFPNSGNDVQVAWTHFDHDSTNSIAYLTRPGFSTNVETDSSNASFKYDAVDLDVGQYFSIGTRLQTRFFVGVRGAQIKNDIANFYIFNTNATSTNPVNLNSKFVGIGPRIGVDTSYHIGKCFRIVGHFATALLVGNVDDSGTDILVNSGGTFINYSTADTQRRVVPSFDAKLGVDYSIAFKNAANGSSLSIEAGYQVTQYLDAIDRFQASNTDTIGSSVVTSSVGFNGPYLSLNLKV